MQLLVDPLVYSNAGQYTPSRDVADLSVLQVPFNQPGDVSATISRHFVLYLCFASSGLRFHALELCQWYDRLTFSVARIRCVRT